MFHFGSHRFPYTTRLARNETLVCSSSRPVVLHRTLKELAVRPDNQQLAELYRDYLTEAL